MISKKFHIVVYLLRRQIRVNTKGYFFKSGLLQRKVKRPFCFTCTEHVLNGLADFILEIFHLGIEQHINSIEN